MVGSPALAGQSSTSPNCLDLVGLSPLMTRTSGRPEISIGLIDGPVALDHPDLAAENIREVPGKLSAACADASDAACAHGTFIAGILLASRMSVAPAICPGCTLLVRPIFSQAPANGGQMPSASAKIGRTRSVHPGQIAGATDIRLACRIPAMKVPCVHAALPASAHAAGRLPATSRMFSAASSG